MNLMDELRYRADRIKNAYNNPVGSAASDIEDGILNPLGMGILLGGIGSVGYVAGSNILGLAHGPAVLGGLVTAGLGVGAAAWRRSYYGNQMLKSKGYSQYATERLARARAAHNDPATFDEIGDKLVQDMRTAGAARIWGKRQHAMGKQGYKDWVAGVPDAANIGEEALYSRYRWFKAARNAKGVAGWLERKATAIPAKILGRIGGPAGLGTVAMHAAMTGVGIGAQLLKDTEGVSRTLLTKGLFGNGKTPLDDWFPHFNSNKLDKHDFRRIAPNPRIARRLIAGNLLLGAGEMIHEAISPAAPPPTMFFDGLHMHHRNDMGTGGRYGSTILGSNSDLNLSGDDIARVLPHLF